MCKDYRHVTKTGNTKRWKDGEHHKNAVPYKRSKEKMNVYSRIHESY
jgi:hypothetical protein